MTESHDENKAPGEGRRTEQRSGPANPDPAGQSDESLQFAQNPDQFFQGVEMAPPSSRPASAQNFFDGGGAGGVPGAAGAGGLPGQIAGAGGDSAGSAPHGQQSAASQQASHGQQNSHGQQTSHPQQSLPPSAQQSPPPHSQPETQSQANQQIPGQSQVHPQAAQTAFFPDSPEAKQIQANAAKQGKNYSFESFYSNQNESRPAQQVPSGFFDDPPPAASRPGAGAPHSQGAGGAGYPQSGNQAGGAGYAPGTSPGQAQGSGNAPGYNTQGQNPGRATDGLTNTQQQFYEMGQEGAGSQQGAAPGLGQLPAGYVMSPGAQTPGGPGAPAGAYNTGVQGAGVAGAAAHGAGAHHAGAQAPGGPGQNSQVPQQGGAGAPPPLSQNGSSAQAGRKQSRIVDDGDAGGDATGDAPPRKKKKKRKRPVTIDDASGDSSDENAGASRFDKFVTPDTGGLFLYSYYQARQIIATPKEFFESMQKNGNMAEPAMFLGICALTAGLLAGLLNFNLLITLQFFFGNVIFSTLIAVGVWKLLAYYGGKGSFEATFRVICYSQAALIIAGLKVGALAYLTLLVATIYSIHLQTIGMDVVHGADKKKTLLTLIGVTCMAFLIRFKVGLL